MMDMETERGGGVAESRNTLRFAIAYLGNLSVVPELKSCFHQELAADVLACYLDVPDAPCKLAALYILARITTEQDLDIICNAQGAISLMTEMVNRPSYKNYTKIENILCMTTGVMETVTLISITAGIRRKTMQPGAELDEDALQEILPELREKMKAETEKRDYTLEWGDIAVHPTRRSVQKWPKARDGLIYVPYKVSFAFYDGDIKKIEEAALEFEKKTCVRFIPRSNETDYIYIHAKDGNWSFLGRQGGDQALSLEPGKVTKGVVLHELMHVLGFHHEHCRSDRDDHVLVLSHNLRPGETFNELGQFKRLECSGFGEDLPYDYLSIMHYGRYASSSDYMSETITPTRAAKAPIGQRSGLSPLDVLRVQRKRTYRPTPAWVWVSTTGSRGPALTRTSGPRSQGPASEPHRVPVLTRTAGLGRVPAHRSSGNVNQRRIRGRDQLTLGYSTWRFTARRPHQARTSGTRRQPRQGIRVGVAQPLTVNGRRSFPPAVPPPLPPDQDPADGSVSAARRSGPGRRSRRPPGS
ncbi:unnamed protein product, partial [Lampetra fluviatilis]